MSLIGYKYILFTKLDNCIADVYVVLCCILLTTIFVHVIYEVCLCAPCSYSVMKDLGDIFKPSIVRNPQWCLILLIFNDWFLSANITFISEHLDIKNSQHVTH